jgi:hypothetical protein
MSVRLTTTLYDLITAIHSVTESDEDELVIALVMHWVRAGRITSLDAVSELPAYGKEEGITMGAEVLPLAYMVG